MLTKEDYFKANNGYLTRSRLQDYRKCPRYFYRKHILNDLEKEEKSAFKIGSAVDDILTQIDNLNKYHVCQYDGRTKDGKDERAAAEANGSIIVSQSDYEQIMGLAIAVMETTAFKDLESHDKQVLLQTEISPSDHFHGLAGLPDFLKIEGDKAIITDLKTAQSIDPKRYYYHCKEYGYFLQQAFYQSILLLMYPNIERFVSRHIVVEKTKDIWNVATFELDQDEIDAEGDGIVETIQAIMADKEFKKRDASWESAVVLTGSKAEDWL